MIGRSKDVAELTLLLGNGLHQVLAGARKEGKSTVCRAATARLRESGTYVVEADLMYLPSLVALAGALVEEAISNRSAPKRAVHAATKTARSALSALSLVAVSRLKHDLGTDLEVVLEPALARRDPWSYFDKAMRMLQRICEVDDTHLVLFLDEFQELGAPRHSYGDPDEVMNLMRAVLQDSPRVTCLFTGSVHHMMRDLFGQSHRAFYKWGAWYSLSEIESEEWKAGLTARLEGSPISFHEPALDHLLELSEGHARTTMLVAQQAYLAALTDGAVLVDAVLVDAAFEMAERVDAGEHELHLRELRGLGRHALDVAIRIAAGQPPYRAAGARSVQRAIEAVAGVGMIEQRGVHGRGGWVVTDPLLRRFLARLWVG